METSVRTMYGEPSVSEDGTFCESFNDTVSRLAQNFEGTILDKHSRLNIQRDQKLDDALNYANNSNNGGAEWDQGSEFVEPGIRSRELKVEDSLINNSMLSHKESQIFPELNRGSITAHNEMAKTIVFPSHSNEVISENFAYNKHNESIYDDLRYFPCLRPEQTSIVKFDEKDPEYISHATLRALLVQLTSPEVIDYNLICDFFLTYRTFSDAHTILNLLLTRLVWALQYVNSRLLDTEKLGKSVLMRTFVVLRHWILNYFYDDFQSDARLCDTFTSQINRIVSESGLIKPTMALEVKIIGDLKFHWLSQVGEFFNKPMEAYAQNSVFDVALPMSNEYFDVKKMTKSNTEQSIHTNPSFRRSAMLSLYDVKTHHKCIVYDGAAGNSENIQLPIGNLVNQHKSSRVSLDDKIKEYYTSKGIRRENFKFTSRREPLAPKHNHMKLTDSSLGLKKTSTRQNTYDAKRADMKAGFSTNGSIKLPTSRINMIVPLSPVKKMRCSVKCDTSKLDGPSESIDHECSRKHSIKRIVEGWTKSLYSPDLRADNPGGFGDIESMDNVPYPEISNEIIGDRVDVLSARIIDELEYVIQYYIADSHQTITETEGTDEKERKSPVMSSSLSPNNRFIDVLFQKEEIHESADTTQKDMSLHDISELNIEKIDNLFTQNSIEHTIEEFDNSFHSQNRRSRSFAGIYKRASKGSKRSSFGGRVTSITWNDDMFEDSESLCNVSARHEANFYDINVPIESDAEKKVRGLSCDSSSGICYSDVDHYDAEVMDLKTSLSSQSPKRRPIHRPSLNEQVCSGPFGKMEPELSRGSSGTTSAYKHESAKSYMTYDSAFSMVSKSSRNDRYSTHLKKKNGYHDLRKLAENSTSPQLALGRLSMSSNISANRSQVHSMSPVQISKRLSTLCVLMELPFSVIRESYASMSTRALIPDETGKMSDFSVSSVFSNLAEKEDGSSYDKRMTLSVPASSASVVIPGISNNILRELASIPDESFNSKNPIQHALYKLEGHSKATSEITTDSTLVSQLPDEALSEVKESPANIMEGEGDSPLQKEGLSRTSHIEQAQNKPMTARPEMMRCKEGFEVQPPLQPARIKRVHVSMKNGENSENAEFDAFKTIRATGQVLDSTATEGAIGYSSDIEDDLRQRPVTPIKSRTKSTSAMILTQSSTNLNPFYASLPASESGSPYSLLNPRLVLDGYNLAAEHLVVDHVLDHGSHVSFILSYDSKTIAEHFTLIERDMLQEIDWRELIELKWDRNLTPVNSWLEIIVNDEYYHKNKGVNLVIARFNLVVNWIISEILLTTSETERCEIVSRMIHVAYHSFEMQNFSTLMQVVLALTSEKVNQLKSMWINLSPGDILTLKHLEQVTSPLKNFGNMRVCTNSIRPSKGCVPFVGLYLSDLIFNAERPKFVKTYKTGLKDEATCEFSVTQEDSTMGSNLDRDSEKMINFSRFRTSVHIVKSLSQSIDWAQNYEVAVDDELLRKCLYIKSLDEGEMNFCLEQLPKL